jgi:hypothetical protein
MAKDPWKRAHDLSRLREHSAVEQPAEARAARRIGCGTVIAIALAVLVVGGAAVLFFTRGWWWPRYRAALPEPLQEVVADVAPEPPADVDWHVLETGLDVELRMFGDYNLFVGATRAWEPGVKLISTGNDTWRLTAPGVRVHVRNGLVWTYELDLPLIFAEECWREWWPALREAGLTPDLTWTALTGEEEQPVGGTDYTYRSTRSTRVAEGWVYPVFILYFADGWLRRVEGAIDFGVSSELEPPAGE